MNLVAKVKLIILLSLISNILSYGIMMGPYVKDPFINKDQRAYNAYNLVSKKVLEKSGGDAGNTEVYPIAIYRQINNGVNYKIITAVKDEKKKKVNFVDSTVYTGPFNNNESTEETTKITHLEKLSASYNVPDEGISLEIADYLFRKQKDGVQILSVDSTVTVPNVIENENFYLVSATIDKVDDIFIRYYIVYQDDKKGLHILKTFDFVEEE